MAIKRYEYLERRFKKNPDWCKQYSEIMQEYIDLKNMIKIDNESEKGFYLPHHAVIKESSTTTKVRVVFDGSAASSSGLSLNDILMTGPTIQDDVFPHLLRLRSYNHVFCGDIEKMYRQVLIRPEDRKYLSVIWKDSDGTLATYQLTVIPFGLKPSPYLAVQTIHKLAQDKEDKYPIAAKIITQNLYVDDLLSGADTIEKTIQIRDQTIALLKEGGFNLRQCASNTPEIVADLPECNINLHLQGSNDLTLKTLGIYWHSKKDLITYTVKPIINNRNITKRVIFSEIAKIFDPLGLLNPITVAIKLIMQELWKLSLHWDESVPLNIKNKWEIFTTQLQSLNEISFDRKILVSEPNNIQLHGFCDASEKAYGACIYIRSTDKHNNVHIQLYCAKSRVAPIKSIQTIPRLELCAALLLANLYVTLQSSVNIQFDQTIFWSDSTIVLNWIQTSPHILKTFVANRVSEIQGKTVNANWKHVRTHDNPADILSRGVLPQDFIKNSIWKKGPTWLSKRENEWPLQQVIRPTHLPDIRTTICLTVSIFDDSILKRYSSFQRLQRIIAISLRFKKSNNHKGVITLDELKNARATILRLIQLITFSQELKCLTHGKPLSNKSKLLTFNPFIDKEGLLRIGGRLQNAKIAYQHKYPMLLPKSHHVTDIIIHAAHINTLHGGVHTTLYEVRQNYWPIDRRNQVRRVIRTCVKCARMKPVNVEYLMGNLPAVRINQTRPFTNVGVDYCGPFFVKQQKFRNRTRVKIWISIFICLATKAVHIEVVSDLTTEGFIAALKRFISRRGKCHTIHSDNGTNFVGANNELKEIYELIKSELHNEKIHNYLVNKGIQWKFIPPQSPHTGGIWEAAVKSCKHHLKRVLGNTLFSFEEFNTLVIEIEAILNSRPLTPISSDPNDLSALTPSHFLIGDTLASLPEQDFSDTPTNRLSMWLHIQKIKQDFWTRWHKEYINEFNIRHKWKNGEHNIQKESIVIIREDNLPPSQWKLGRIIDIHPGEDGIIRNVTIKTSTGVTKRHIKRIAPLPVPIMNS